MHHEEETESTNIQTTARSQCADPESFVSVGPTLAGFLVDEEREDPKPTSSGPSLNAGLEAL